jgi:Cu-Zn family superoxide dismutase
MSKVNRRTVLVQMSVLAGAALIALATNPAPAAAQTAHADIVNSQGAVIGHAKLSTVSNGVKVSVTVSQLAPGEHGIHIHNVGKCDGPAFTTAGGHFNPTGAHHGMHNAQEPHPHLGDLPNLVVSEKGTGKLTFTAVGVTISEGPNSLFHEGGTSLVIHAKADDLTNDPSGNSGDRIACGVIIQ